MGRLRKIVAATVAQQGLQIAVTIVSLVAVPLYLAHLGTERYGLFLTAQVWAGYLRFGTVGISQSTMILVSHASADDDPRHLSTIVRTSLLLSALAAGAAFAVSFCAMLALRNHTLASALKLTHPEAPGLVLAIGFQVVCSLLFSTFYDLLIGLQRASIATVLQGTGHIAGQLVGLWIVVQGGSVGQVTTGSAVASVVVGFACVAEAWRAHPEAFAGGRVTRQQVVLQLRTGTKSLGLQLGATLAGTAPTLALATLAGPAAVPLFAVPARLLSMGTGIVSSFAALMQPAFGEAYARGDLAWVRSTLSQLSEKTLLAMSLGAAVLIGLGGAVVSTWTAGKLEVSPAMLTSVALAGGVATVIGPLKFLLAGINQHRWAAVTELANGVLAVLFSFIAVRALAPDWVGLGVFAAAACTSLWSLPALAKRQLGMQRVMPNAVQLLKMALCALSVYGSALLMSMARAELAPRHAWAGLFLSAAAVAATCAASVVALNLIDWRELYKRFRALRT
jgi:O-antigen/teichoic acid export membrane protein